MKSDNILKKADIALQVLLEHDAQELKRLRKKSIFVTSDSIKFTTDEYDKLKTAFCKGKGVGPRLSSHS